MQDSLLSASHAIVMTIAMIQCLAAVNHSWIRFCDLILREAFINYRRTVLV